jgi:hypothetical protein
MAKNKPDVYLHDRIYIAVDSGLITQADINRRYKVNLYSEKDCVRCSLYTARHEPTCDTCPNFFGNYRFFEVVKKGGRNYYSLPLADILFVKKKLRAKKYTSRNKPILPPMTSDLRFTGKLFGKGAVDADGNPRANQKRIVKKWLLRKNGIIKAQPRTGKTVIATYLACKLRTKTLIIADRFELLNQFYWTFVGNKKKGRPPMTNGARIEKKTGKPVVKLVTKMKDLLDEDVDVFLINPQKLVHKQNEKIENYLKGRFGFVVVDEVHGAAATSFSQFVYKIDAPYRLGLSATPDRKDGRNALTDFTIGPVTVRSKTVTLKPTIEAYEVQSTPPYAYRSWSGGMRWLADSGSRNTEIVRRIFKDLRAGHKSIIIPVAYKRHMNNLVKAINAQARINRIKRGEKWPAELAMGFFSGCDRKRVLTAIDGDKPCVMVAISSMIRQGVDMSRPSMLHVVIPMSASQAVGAPMFKQLSFRVCTPFPGKTDPRVCVWVDKGIDMFRRATTGLLFQEIIPGVKKKEYRIDQKAYTVMSGRGNPTAPKTFSRGYV